MRRPAGRDARIARRHLVIVLIAALGAALWRLVAGDPVTDALEDRLLDARFALRGPVAPPEDVVLVALDAAAVDRLGWAPPPRAAIAEALARVAAAGPRVVALDLLFLDPTAEDAALAAAIPPGGRVVLGAAIGNAPAEDAARPAAVEEALRRSAVAVVAGEVAVAEAPPRLLTPRPELLERAALAHVNISRSADRVARRAPLALWIGAAGFLPSISLEAARRLAGVERGAVALHPGARVVLGGREIATDAAGAVAINHYGGRGTIPTVGLLDVLSGAAPAETFAGRAVFFGATAESLSDLFATPYGADVPGVEVLATLAANLASGEVVVRDRRTGALSAALSLALAALVYAAARRRRLEAALAILAAAWAAGLAALQLAFSAGLLWLDATAVVAALAFATGWCGWRRLGAERRLAAAVAVERRNLARYQSPFLAEHLAEGEAPSFSGRTQDAAVLFVDVAGFTALVERATPGETAAFLSEVHRFYERCATAHGGVIVSFIGDGALVVFGLPAPGPGDAGAALDCGRRLLAEAEGFDSAVFPGTPLRLRVSVHHGPITPAVLGGARQAQITVAGDVVNVASRLQDAAKAHGVPFVASRAALDAARTAGDAAADGFERLAEEPLRGRSGRVEVWAAQPGGMPESPLRASTKSQKGGGK